jgi:hypothetical protein
MVTARQQCMVLPCTMWTWNVGLSATVSASPLVSTVEVGAGFGLAPTPLMDTRCSHPLPGTSQSSRSSGGRRTDLCLMVTFLPATTRGPGTVCVLTHRTTLLGPAEGSSQPCVDGGTISRMKRMCGATPVDGTACHAWCGEGRVTRVLRQGEGHDPATHARRLVGPADARCPG